MNFYQMAEMSNEHLAQLHKEAESYRHFAKEGQSENVIRPALAELGRRLQTVGQHLEACYGARTTNDLAGQYH